MGTATATVRPRPGLLATGQILAAAVLGAVAVLGQFMGFTLGFENPPYRDQLVAGGTAWLLAGCLAAAMACPGWRGWAAAWIGSLGATIHLVTQVVALSGTTQADPFWWNVGVAFWSGVTAGLLALGQAAVLVAAKVGPRWRRLLPTAALLVLATSSVVLLTLPETPYAGPQPAPSAPPGLGVLGGEADPQGA